MQEFEIVFYDKPDGSEPVKEFLLSVDNKMRARLLRTLALLAQRDGFADAVFGTSCGRNI